MKLEYRPLFWRMLLRIFLCMYVLSLLLCVVLLSKTNFPLGTVTFILSHLILSSTVASLNEMHPAFITMLEWLQRFQQQPELSSSLDSSSKSSRGRKKNPQNSSVMHVVMFTINLKKNTCREDILRHSDDVLWTSEISADMFSWSWSIRL